MRYRVVDVAFSFPIRYAFLSHGRREKKNRFVYDWAYYGETGHKWHSKLSRHSSATAKLIEVTWHDIGIKKIQFYYPINVKCKTPLKTLHLSGKFVVTGCREKSWQPITLTEDMGKCFTIIPHANHLLVYQQKKNKKTAHKPMWRINYAWYQRDCASKRERFTRDCRVYRYISVWLYYMCAWCIEKKVYVYYCMQCWHSEAT